MYVDCSLIADHVEVNEVAHTGLPLSQCLCYRFVHSIVVCAERYIHSFAQLPINWFTMTGLLFVHSEC